ncbi:MAG: cupin domain-containing protein [Acidobacteria bacterium]|nr:cupin domain-containing protein [Acidobacteriota bacterium]
MFISRSSMSPIDFHGLRIFDYTAGQSLGSSVAVIEVAPGVRHTEAWSRRSDKYYLVTRGQVQFTLDGEPHVIGAGDFCLVRCGRHFSYSNESPEAATLVLVHTPGFDLREEVFAGQ